MKIIQVENDRTNLTPNEDQTEKAELKRQPKGPSSTRTRDGGQPIKRQQTVGSMNKNLIQNQTATRIKRNDPLIGNKISYIGSPALN